MVKKAPPRPPLQTEFRESDFAGMRPADQAELSGSLNRLSQELVATRQLLNDIERPATPTPADDAAAITPPRDEAHNDKPPAKPGAP